MSAPPIAQIRAAIVAVLQALPDAGIVHDRLRYATDPKGLQALYGSQGKIRGWTVRRRATAETSTARGRSHVNHTWEIVLLVGFDGQDSEAVFDALIEAARDAFRDDDSLGDLVATTGTGEGPQSPIGLQLDDAQPAMFGGVLVHLGQMSLVTRHHV